MNILKTKHLYVLASFFLFALVSATGLNKAYAANLDVICDGDSCDEIGSPTLFNETNWYPGSTLTKTIQVTNNGPDEDCYLTVYATNVTQTPAGFAKQLNTAVKKNDEVIYGELDGTGSATDTKTLQNIFDDNADFGMIPQDGDKGNYEWTLTFNKDADNTFSNASTNFSFNIDFRCASLDRDGGGGNHNSKNKNGGNGGGAVAGAATGGGITNLLNFFAGGMVAGAETVEQPKPEETPKVSGASTTVPTEAVQGAANKVCEVSGLLWLGFVAQFLLHIIVKFLFKERKAFYIAQLLILAAFIIAFFTVFCVWWDVLVSLLIGIVALWFIKLFSD